MSRLLWTQRQDFGPPEGPWSAMVFDEARGYALLVNLHDASTWQWDGMNWLQVADIGPRTSAPSLAYDPNRNTILTTGRWTYEWDGTAWTQVADTDGGGVGPLAYDRSRGKFLSVKYGDAEPPKPFVETWEWDGSAWTQVADDGPSVRTDFDIAYDQERKVLVLFGGADPSGARVLGDTWIWSGMAWEQIADMGPPARRSHRMVYDSSRSRTVLFGGARVATDPKSGGIPPFGDTWEWDGTRWLQLQDMGPPPRVYPAMAYDTIRRRIVMFGGAEHGLAGPMFHDTWEFGEYN